MARTVLALRASMTTPPTVPDPRRHLERARAVARLLDNALPIPGTDRRIGLDPLLGLVPGLGDLAGAAGAVYVIIAGAQLGASRAVIARMVLNVGIDTVIGTIPLIGDLFDAGWKANARNVAMIERHLESPVATRRASVWTLALAVLGLVAIAAGGVWLAVVVGRRILDAAS